MTSPWRQLDFNDNSWQIAKAPFGYMTSGDSSFLNTELSNATSVYFRTNIQLDSSLPNRIEKIICMISFFSSSSNLNIN